jgi:hypothetical protein
MIDIFIKSYPKDFEYLYLCLESINKFVTGYEKIHLVLPEGSNVSFKPQIVPARIQDHYIKEEGDGYLFQQYCKMTAYKWCKSDYVMFIDSDCIFNRKINVNTLLNKGKSTILKTKWDKVGDAKCWHNPTSKYFEDKLIISHEYMRRNAMIYRKDTLENVSSLKKNLKSYVLSIKERQFSEFNVIGAFAENYESDKYNFLDTDNWTYEPHFVYQGWSWGGIDKEKEEILKILR